MKVQALWVLPEVQHVWISGHLKWLYLYCVHSKQENAVPEEYGVPANTLDPSISWKDVYWLQSITRLPIIIKGILTKEDAELALEHGVQGIIVSNHGGRQLDGSPASVDTEHITHYLLCFMIRLHQGVHVWMQWQHIKNSDWNQNSRELPK